MKATNEKPQADGLGATVGAAIPTTYGRATEDSLHPNGRRVKTFFVDGSCEPRNPGGWACWGWLVYDDQGFFLASGRGCVGHGDGMTNNVAEYHAALQALRWAAGQGLTEVLVRTDSQLLANQAMGKWGCNANNLWGLLVEVRALMAEIGAVFEWIPREENTRADALSRQAYAEARRNGRQP